MAASTVSATGAGPTDIKAITSVKVKRGPDDDGTDDSQDAEDEDDIPFGWQISQQTATDPLLWKLSDPLAVEHEEASDPGNDLRPFTDPHDSYFLLDKTHFTRLCLAKQGVQDAYISVQTYKTYLAKQPCDKNFPFPNRQPKALPIRTENGSTVWLEPYPVKEREVRANSRVTPQWSDVYATSVAPAQNRNYARRYVTVNGSTLKLFLLPMGKLTKAKLTAACQGFPANDFEILEPKGKIKSGLIKLDESPFGQYETWVQLSQLKADTRDNLADQPFPTQEIASQLTVLPPPTGDPGTTGKKRARRSPTRDTKAQAAATKLDKQRRQVKSTHPPIVFAVNVSYTNMYKAAGKKRPRGQATVMGNNSATTFAKKFRWVTVAGAAEPENLLFGSYQTNSLMTRREKAYQMLFAKEDSIRRKINQDTNFVKGIIHTKQNTKTLKWNTVSGTRPVAAATETPEPVPDWVMYNMEYELRLSQGFTPLLLNGECAPFKTDFYPFQRPFYTQLEFNLDNKLLDNAYEERLASHQTAGHHASVSRMALWKRAAAGESVEISGALLESPSIVSINEHDHMIEAPASALSLTAAKDVTVTTISPNVAIRGLTQSSLASSMTSLKIMSNAVGNQAFKEDIAAIDPSAIIPPGFVLSGDLNAFGALPGKLYTFQGASGGIHEILALESNTTLGGLLPDLTEIDIAGIVIKNVQLEYTDDLSAPQNKTPGLRFEADIVLGGILQPLSDLLSSFFNLKEPVVHMECFLGFERDWTELTPPRTITMTGTFESILVPFGDHLTFTSCGINLRVATERQEDNTDKMVHVFSYDFFGTGLLSLPGTVAPLTVDMTLTLDDDLVSLDLQLHDDWANAFGFQGLTLSSVQVEAHFGLTVAAREVGFQVAALINGPIQDITLDGYFVDGDWALTAEITDLDMDSFCEMFSGLLGGSMDDVPNDIEFLDITLDISPAGISLEGVLSIDGYTTLDGVLSLDESGVDINGAIEDVKIDELTIVRASLNLYAERKGLAIGHKKTKAIGFAIMGTVEFSGLHIAASLYVEKLANGSMKWTAYGDYEETISTSTLAPELRGSFLDLPMRQVSLLAGNATTAAAGFINQFNYPIIKGIQIMATIDHIAALNTLTHINTDGLVLRVGLVQGLGLDFGIMLPADNAIKLGPTVTSAGPLAVDIQIAAPPTLVISAGFHVVVPKQDDPLNLNLQLSANPIQASGTTSISGFWKNPFGLGQQVKIGPTLSLSVGLTFATFPVTGPSLLSLAGGLEIGSTVAGFAMSISQNPLQEMLQASLSNLSMADLASFASTVVQETIPPPGESVIKFEDLSIYISAGTTIGAKQYPPGFAFDAKALIFGKQAIVSCSIGHRIELAGSIDTFSLGLLEITNSTIATTVSQPKLSHAGQSTVMLTSTSPSQPTGPSFSLAIGKTEQKFLLDGGVKLLEADAAIHVEAELLPSPKFSFLLGIAFSNLLSFTITGAMLGAFDPAHIQDLDFALSATFEQNILDFLMDQATAQLTAITTGAQQGFVTAQANLQAAQAAHQQAVTDAQASLTAAQAAFDAKRAVAQSQVQQVTSNMTSGQASRQKTIDDDTAAFNAKLSQVQAALLSSQQTSQTAIAAAQSAVTTAQASAQQSIQSAQSSVTSAQDNLQHKFGNVDAQIQSAQSSVQSAKADSQQAEAAVAAAQDAYNHASGFGKVSAKAELTKKQAVLASKNAALSIAQSALSAAQAIVDGPGYAAAKASLSAAQSSLRTATEAANASVKAAQDAVPGVIAAQKQLTDKAAAAVNEARTSGVEIKALQAAQASLAAFTAEKQKVLDAAKASLAALDDIPEAAAVAAAIAKLAVVEADAASLVAAKGALEIAQKAEAAAPGVAAWVVKQTGHLLDIRMVTMSGTLKGVLGDGGKQKPMVVTVKGVIAEQDVDVTVDYTIGRTDELVKGIFGGLWKLIEEGTVKLT
ncbi:MAG: hypothetical protein Q9218_004824 [Villophora microphyllina]